MDNIADKLVNEMNEPRTDLPENKPFENFRDIHGRAFDPELHRADDKGNPVLTKRGKLYVKKKIGPPTKDQGTMKDQGGVKSNIGIPNVGTIPAQGVDPQAQAMAVGVTVAQMTFTLGIAVGGQEWKPTNQENDYMSYAWGQYFAAKGVRDLPPGVIVATALISYVGPRLTKPTTKQKIGGLLNWIKSKIRKNKDAAQPNNRNDGKRENDPGNDTFPGIPSKGD